MKRALTISLWTVSLICILLAVAICASAATVYESEYSTDGATTFAEEDAFTQSKQIVNIPATLETTVKFPASYASSYPHVGNDGRVYTSVIFSNYSSGKYAKNCVNYEIDQNGAPFVTVYDSQGSGVTYKFSEVNVFTGEWVNLAIVIDGGSISCYVDGALAQTLVYKSPSDIVMTRALMLGDSYRTVSGVYGLYRFKGAMKNLSVYSDVRLTDEIISDITAPAIDDAALLCHYDLIGADNADIIPDASANGNYVVRDEIMGGIELTEKTNRQQTGTNYYVAQKVTASFETFEIMMRVDEEDYGVVYSNYTSGLPNCLRFEVLASGYPKMAYWDKNGASMGVEFRDINLFEHDWVHVTVVRDLSINKVLCYLNGTLAQAVNITKTLDEVEPTRAMKLGRDWRTGTGLIPFTGEIMSIATYSDVRSAAEIRRDIACGAEIEENMISYYDFRFAKGCDTIPDRSGNGATLVNPALPVDENAIEGSGYTPIYTGDKTQNYGDRAVEKYTTLKAPRTIEAVIKLNGVVKSDTDTTATENDMRGSTAGTIVGNYAADKNYNHGVINLDIVTGNIPKLVFRNANGEVSDLRFTKAVVPVGEWVHIAFAVDDTEVRCYINGVLKATATTRNGAGSTNRHQALVKDDLQFNLNGHYPLAIGYNQTQGYNTFKGALKSVALYSDMRSAEEIADDMYFPGADDLLGYYDTSNVGYREDIEDLSNNNNDALHTMGDRVVYANDPSGYTSNRMQSYQTEEKLTVSPKTFAAVIKYSSYVSNKENVIISNYRINTKSNVFAFSIDEASHPKIYAVDDNGIEHTIVFDNVSVFSTFKSQWMNVTVTLDAESGRAYCYVNGALRQKLAYDGFIDLVKANEAERPLVIGSDYSSGQLSWFDRKLKSVSLWSDVRCAEEIYQDVRVGVDISDEALSMSYDMDSADGGIILNKNGNGNDAYYYDPMYEKEERDPDSYAYSIAIVGDTQTMTYSNPTALATLYDWIIANKDEKKISFVMGLGDINEKDSDKEWGYSSVELKKLADAGIPQSIVCGGNHDTMPNFERWLPTDYFLNAYDGIMEIGFWEGDDNTTANDTNGPTLANAYSIITIGQTKYMFLTLEWAPRAAQVEWANEVIAAHPDCNVIVSTHAYLYEDGTHYSAYDRTTPDNTGTKSAYNGDELWNELVRKHENIVMVVCGHNVTDYVVMREDYGDNGNRILQLLIDPQYTDGAYSDVGMTGMVAMLYFSEDGSQVDFEYYSTVQEKHFMEENQFSFEMPTISEQAKEISQVTVSHGDNINVNYYAHVKGNFSSVQMRFTINGASRVVDGVKVDGLNKYRFTCEGIAPQMMGDEINAVLIVDGVVTDKVDGFTVEGYAHKLLDMNWAELALATTKEESIERADALHALLVDLLDYGASAQNYKNYKPDELVNRGVSDSDEFDASIVESVKASTTPVGDSGAKFAGATVRFDNVNSLRFDFTIGNASLTDISVVIGGITYSADDFTINSTGKYSVYSKGISAVKFGSAVVAELRIGDEVVHSVTYSVNSYVKSMYGSESIGDLAVATYFYGEAAKAYVSAFSE